MEIVDALGCVSVCVAATHYIEESTVWGTTKKKKKKKKISETGIGNQIPSG
jgi:hypothetical protein